MCLISVAKRLLERGEVNFANSSFHVVKPTQQYDDDDDDDESSYNESRDHDNDDDDDVQIFSASPSTAEKGSFADPRTVEVSGVIKDISKDLLFMYFENEAKSGGGRVEGICKYDDNTAYVTFESSDGNCFAFYLTF